VPQLKLKLATLAPLGVPRTATVLKGNGADEPL